MPVVSLTKKEAARALANFHFKQGSLEFAFQRLGSVQFDPLSPIGSNHDLVLNARVIHYKIDDWKQIAYNQRAIYDGWDKMASLVSMDLWPVRRFYHDLFRNSFDKIFNEHPHAVEAILKEISNRGPMQPKNFEFQEHKPDWAGSWYGPSLTKQTLRALWHCGYVMTSNRVGKQHVYDLTERVVPAHLLKAPHLTQSQAIKQIVFDRHRAMGLLRPTAPFEVWSLSTRLSGARHQAIRDLKTEGNITEVEIEGMTYHVIPDFLEQIQKKPKKRVTFLAPLDQFMWDRKAIQHIFGFNYVWEVYVPEAKRRWGYYVLPILYGDQMIGRAEFIGKRGILNVKSWMYEQNFVPSKNFIDEASQAILRLMNMAELRDLTVEPSVGSAFRDILEQCTKRFGELT